jgi:prophage regulatory protein
MPTTILRLPAVQAATGCSRSTIYLRIAQGLFTRPIKLGRCAGWPESEIDAVNTAVIAGQSDAQLRALVSRLEASRKARLK